MISSFVKVPLQIKKPTVLGGSLLKTCELQKLRIHPVMCRDGARHGLHAAKKVSSDETSVRARIYSCRTSDSLSGALAPVPLIAGNSRGPQALSPAHLNALLLDTYWPTKFCPLNDLPSRIPAAEAC